MSGVRKHAITAADQIGGFFTTGTIVGASAWSETHVSATTSGGGTSGHGTGYITTTAPTTTVSSTVTEVNRFFLRSGQEEDEYTLRGGRFGVRDGHIVSVIHVGPAVEKWGYNLAFVNHSTGKTLVDDDWIDSLVIKKPNFASAVLLLVLSLISIMVFLPVGAASLIIILPVVASLVFDVRSKMRKQAQRTQLIEAVRLRRQDEIEAAKAAYAARKTNVVELEQVAS